MIDLASFIEVPPTDIAEGRVFAPQRSAEQQRMFPALLAIHQGSSAPLDACVAVPYRNNWYWRDDSCEIDVDGVFLSSYGVALPVLALSGGIVQFLAALKNVLEKFEPTSRFTT